MDSILMSTNTSTNSTTSTSNTATALSSTTTATKSSTSNVLSVKNPRKIYPKPNYLLNPGLPSIPSLKSQNLTITVHENELNKSSLSSINNHESIKLLNNGVLPPFRANLPISPWLKVDTPSGGYKCVDCGDIFLLDLSLKQHLERRSLYIHFPCEICSLSLIYYNRCSLLAHVRNHKKKNQISDISKAIVTPLSKELLISNLVSPIIQPGINGSTCSALLSQMSRDSTNEISANNAKGGKYRCTECFQHFESADQREQHLSSGQSNSATLSLCTKCAIICPSKCSLQAHQRIHSKIMPYVCPECGEQCSNNSWEQFMFHLENHCYHFSRSISYNCFICDASHIASNALQKHILKTHTKVYVKCQACPMAFNGTSAFDYHKQAAHSSTSTHSKTIFKCPLCDTVFHGKEQLLHHLSVHINDKLCHAQYVFRCSECPAVHKSKYLLLDHMEVLHPKVRDLSQSLENSLGLKTPFPASQILIGSGGGGDSQTGQCDSVNCPICNQTFQSSSSYATHYRECHINKGLSCPVCSVRFVTKNLLIEHEKFHLKEGTLICMLCHKSDFSQSSEFEKHIRGHIDEMEFPVKCNHCDSMLADKNLAKTHINNEHFISSPNGPLLRTRIDVSAIGLDSEIKYPCPICGKKLSRKSLLRKHIARFHGNHKQFETLLNAAAAPVDGNLPPIKIRIPLQNVKSETSSSSQVDESPNGKLNTIKNELNESPPTPPQTQNLISTKKLRIYCKNEIATNENCEYICAKCDFQCLEAIEFRQHIMIHRRDHSSLQCPECGTCFVVELSLRKHLVVAHRVTDVEEYMKEAQVFIAETSAANIICNNGNNSWQCRVCCATFDNESSLRFHMRSHGMAFIRSKAFSGSNPN